MCRRTRSIGVLLVLLVILITACGKTSRTDIDTDEEQTNMEYDSAEEGDGSDVSNASNDYYEEESSQDFQFEHACYPYGNGLTWVQFATDDDEVAGVVDKEGNLLYYSSLIDYELNAPLSLFNENRSSFVCGKTGASNEYYQANLNGELVPLEWTGAMPVNYTRPLIPFLAKPMFFGEDMYLVYKPDGSVCSDEYMCLETLDEGIDGKKANYIFYDTSGNKVGDLSLDYADGYSPKILYLGKGKFAFLKGVNPDYGEYASSTDILGIYFAKSNKWVEKKWSEETFQTTVRGSEDYAIILPDGPTYDIPSAKHYEFIYTDKLGLSAQIYDESGNEKTITFGDEKYQIGAINNYMVSNTTAIFSVYLIDDALKEAIESGKGEGISVDEAMHNALLIYDIASDKFRIFDGEYSDRFNYELICPETIIDQNTEAGAISDDFFAINIKGADFKDYVGLYDIKTLELKCDPIQVGELRKLFIINDSIFIRKIADDPNDEDICCVYDKDGNLVKEFNTTPSVFYGDGIYTCDFDGGYAEFYDEEWDLLFTSDEINYSEAKPFTVK